jgi:cytosine/adenosine deaminase-related metal-dependent hydrolase
MSDFMKLYRAPFVVTGKGPVLEDGAILVCGNTIAAVDRFAILAPECAHRIDCEGRVLTPALINCHAHLELSWLAGTATADGTFPRGDITAWIAGLLKKRDQCSPTDEVIMAAAVAGLQALYENGTILVADIGNRDASAAIGSGHPADVLFFLEMMGLTQRAAEQNLRRLADLELSATAHGPYSVNPALIQNLKRRARDRSEIFPLHIAESLDEVEFLVSGQGRFYDFLDERLKAIGEFDKQSLSEVFKAPGCRAVEYLDQLGVLDEQTLCVHAVHVNESEVELLARKKAKVCLCPGSNRYIGVGVAPVAMFLDKGILPGLGTDSLASNASLNLFAEMSTLSEDYPGLDPELIFQMATIGGAQSLHMSSRLGSLEKGKQAAILAVEVDGIDVNEIFPFLVQRGEKNSVKWLDGFNG